MGRMAGNHQILLTATQRHHQRVMHHVVMALQDTPYVLKGGTALLLTRGLDRHSTDLDFDAGRKLNIRLRIKRGMEAAGVELKSFTFAKNTDSVQRYKIHYVEPSSGDPVLLKIETSFRNPPDEGLVEKVNGIRTYRIEGLIEQKIDALTSRTEARDLYDLEFLARAYGKLFTPAQLTKLGEIVTNPDGLVSRFDAAIGEDDILAGRVRAETLVLNLMDAIDKLQQAASLR